MVDEGPWEPIEEADEEAEDEEDPQGGGRGFWDYALIGVVIALVAVVGVVLASSQTASTQWSLDIRGELGEYDEAVVVTDDGTVVFDAGIGFAGEANDDVVENVQVRAIGQNGNTIASRCLGTLTNDADHQFRTFQFNLTQEPGRVLVEVTDVQNGSEYFIRGWSRTGGTMGGHSMFVENRSTYRNESACQ
jgi:hypothetical protein